MNKRKSSRDIGCSAAELRDGDGVEPRRESRMRASPGNPARRNHSDLRLARQIGDAIWPLISQCGNPLLASLAVGAVEPSPKGTVFVAQVYSTDPAADYDPREVKEALDALKPKLRAAVAREVTRKHAPDFKFDVLPPRVQPK